MPCCFVTLPFSALKERADAEYMNRKLIADQYHALRDKAIEQMKKIDYKARNDPERVLQGLEAVGTWGENLREASYRVLETFSLDFSQHDRRAPDHPWESG
jgi:hypothetical protein